MRTQSLSTRNRPEREFSKWACRIIILFTKMKLFVVAGGKHGRLSSLGLLLLLAGVYLPLASGQQGIIKYYAGLSYNVDNNYNDVANCPFFRSTLRRSWSLSDGGYTNHTQQQPGGP